MVEGAKSFMQVPVELVSDVLAYLTARFPNWETKKRGVKPVVWTANALGEISVKGLPAPVMEKNREYVRGVIDGLTGVGFRADEDTDAEAEEVGVIDGLTGVGFRADEDTDAEAEEV